MKTVLYYDYVRNRKNFLQNLLTWMILFLIVFLVSFTIEKLFPDINLRYLKWPDMIQDFLGIGSWNRHVYVNLWNVFAILFPIHLIYVVMSGLINDLIQEERLETIVYLQNLSICRAEVMLSKLLFWAGYTFSMLLVLLVENVVFFLILGNQLNIGMLIKYYGVMFFSCIVYLAFTLFLSSYSQDEGVCNNTIADVLTYSIVLAKAGPFVHLLADLMVMRGQEGEIIGKLNGVADKLDVLNVMCPVGWCWPGVNIQGLYCVCGVILAIALLVGAFWIYESKGKSSDISR